MPDDASFCPYCGKKQPEAAPQQRKKRRRPKGSGSVYKLSGTRSKPYVALTAKRDVLGTFATPGEAVQALDAYNVQNTPAARLKCTFADAYAQWKAQPKFDKLGTDMKKGYELAYTKASPLYDRQLRDLKTADYQQVIDQMVEKGLSRSSCEKQRTLFSQICEWAMAQDIINKNYAMLLQLPAATGKAERTLTAQEIEQINSRQDDPKLGQTAKIAMVLLYTGMRIDELLSMRCDDVHLKERYMQGGEKTEAGKNRIIPILDPIYKIIAFWMLDSGCEWLIPSKAGTKLDKRNVATKFRALMQECHIDGVHPHTLRHTASSKMVECGLEKTAVQAILGHKNFSTTANKYVSHNDPAYLLQEMRKMKY
jgi:site-specific recombinase XerD|nr:MAG TPA: Integrase [Caudoviricetes sp.]